MYDKPDEFEFNIVNFIHEPVELTEKVYKKQSSLYMTCSNRGAALPFKRSKIISFGLVRKFVKLSSFLGNT